MKNAWGLGCVWRGAVVIVWLALIAPQVSAVEEIIVTTRKIEENLQNVPVAVTAFSARTIEEARIETLGDIAGMTPGLNFFDPQGNLPVPVIRGIAPTDIFGAPNAATFVDGVFAAGREGLNFSMLDVERIEVNKGPQSALYGRNAFSGALNYITKRPTDEFEAKAEITGGNRDRMKAMGSISGPLVQGKLAGRLGLSYDDWSGSYDNPLSSEDVGGYKYRTFQGGLLWTPGDTIEVLVNAYYSQDEIDDTPMTSQLTNCENVGNNDTSRRRLANYCGELWDLDRVRALYNSEIIGNPNIPVGQQFFTDSEQVGKIAGAKGQEREVIRLSLNFDWDLSYGTISALSGYSDVKEESVQDWTRNLGFAFPLVYCDQDVFADPETNIVSCSDFLTPKRFTSGQLIVSPEDETEEFSQEIRFTSPQDGAIRYSLGGYFFYFQDSVNQATIFASSPTLPPGLADPSPPPSPGASFGPFLGGLALGETVYRDLFTPESTAGVAELVESEAESYAGFGALDIDVTDKLTLDFQLRYTWDRRAITLTAPRITSARTATKDFTFVTGRAGMRYQFSDNLMVYGSVSNGNKPGGFTADIVDVLADPDDPGSDEKRIVIVPFDEEKLLSYELGAKGILGEGWLRYDVAVYYQDWTEIVIPQLFSEDPLTGDILEQPERFNKNAGDATVMGFEMQGDISFTDNFLGGLGVSYTDAEMDSAKIQNFEEFPSFAPDGDVSGNKVLRQPKWQANANLSYSRQIAGDWEWSARGDVIYQDKVYGGLDNQWTIPEHTYVNFRLAINSERYSISLWAKNLFNDDSPIAGFRDVWFGNTDDIFQKEPAVSTVKQFFPFRITVNHPALRTYGLTAQVRFGGARR